MTDGRTLHLSGLFTLATLTLNEINAGVAFATGLCGLIVVLPRAIKTVRETDWKHLFTRK